MALMLPAASGCPTHGFFCYQKSRKNNIKPNVSIQDFVWCCKSEMFSKIAIKRRIRCTQKKRVAFAAYAPHVTRMFRLKPVLILMSGSSRC